jgi:hypothetical protein
MYKPLLKLLKALTLPMSQKRIGRPAGFEFHAVS